MSIHTTNYRTGFECSLNNTSEKNLNACEHTNFYLQQKLTSGELLHVQNLVLTHRKWTAIPATLALSWYTLSFKLSNYLLAYLNPEMPLIRFQEPLKLSSPDGSYQYYYYPAVSYPVPDCSYPLANKIICSLPLIGAYPTAKSENSLVSGIIKIGFFIKLTAPTLLKDGDLTLTERWEPDCLSAKKAVFSLIILKNDYKLCSIIRAVLTAALTVSIVALTVFALGAPSTITTVTAHGATLATVAITVQQLFDMTQNNIRRDQYIKGSSWYPPETY